MDVKVLGTGCTKCKKLYAEAEKAVAEAGVTASLSKVERIEDIMAFGVLSTPALVIDGEVKATGRVPAAKEIAGWLRAKGA
jgi:small redox-active disulfide protein 2